MAPVPRAKFHLYRSNVSPQRGEKNIFGPLSRRNIGRHAQRAGRPAGNNKLHSRLISGVHTWRSVWRPVCKPVVIPIVVTVHTWRSVCKPVVAPCLQTGRHTDRHVWTRLYCRMACNKQSHNYSRPTTTRRRLPPKRSSRKRLIHVRTSRFTPSSDDTFGTVFNLCTRNADRLHVVIERQRRRQPYYGDVVTRSRVWESLMHNDRNIFEYLPFIVRYVLQASYPKQSK